MNRKKPCDVCGSNMIETDLKSITYIDGSIDEEYTEKCINCENLLYGWIKRVKVGDMKLLKEVGLNE